MSRPPVSIRIGGNMPECGNNTPDNCGDNISYYLLNNNVGMFYCGNVPLLSV